MAHQVQWVQVWRGGHASPRSEAAPGGPPTFQWNVGHGQWECQGLRIKREAESLPIT